MASVNYRLPKQRRNASTQELRSDINESVPGDLPGSPSGLPDAAGWDTCRASGAAAAGLESTWSLGGGSGNSGLGLA